MCRRYHRELATRNIAPNGLDRDILVPEDNTRHRFDLDIQHRIALYLSEIANLFLRKADVRQFARGELRDQCIDFFCA